MIAGMLMSTLTADAARKYLENKIVECNTGLLNQKKLEQQEFNNYKKKNPNAELEKFFSSNKNTILSNQAFLEIAKSILDDLKLGASVNQVMQNLLQQATSIDKIRNDELANHELILGKPNQALIKTISETQKNKQKVLVVVGKAHVCKIKPYVPERQKIVQQFFKELDKFADKNPYSVLACPGNDLNNPQARKRRK